MSSEVEVEGTPGENQSTAAGQSETTGDQQTLLSKNQIKRQKKKEKWLQMKAEKRHAEKEKRKRRFAEMRERGENMGPSRKSLKKKRMVDSACQQRVIIDCSFDSFMTEKDVSFLVQQIQHSYAANRRAENPLQLYVSGIGGKTKQRLDSIGDYKGWDIHKEERDFTELFPKEEIVYLSSESPNILDTLDESRVYVIGGLVDHNHHKGLCHRLAEERGLAHAQLPIGQFLKLKSRKVLTINHVFEILLHFTETHDWQTALLTVLPQRKGICLKDSKNKDAEADNSENTSRDSLQDIGETCATDETKQALSCNVNESKDLSVSDLTNAKEITDDDSHTTQISLTEDKDVKNAEEGAEVLTNTKKITDDDSHTTQISLTKDKDVKTAEDTKKITDDDSHTTQISLTEDKDVKTAEEGAEVCESACAAVVSVTETVADVDIDSGDVERTQTDSSGS